MNLAKHQNEYSKADIETKLDLINDKLAWHITEEQKIHNGCVTTNEKFDRHLEIYANNGKEMKQMWQTMNEFREEMKPVMEAFNGASWTGKALIKLLAIFGSILGLVLAYREVFKK